MSPTASPRVALADVADRVIAQMDGVALTDGGLVAWQTVQRDRTIHGITAVAQAGGRYELGLRIAVAWPPEPLLGLAEEMRHRIGVAAAETDLADALGDINVAIVAVCEPGSVRR